MNNDLLLIAFLGFSAGYIFKTLMYAYKTFSATATFVQQMGYQAIMLLGSSVYKVAYVDQICEQVLEKMGKTEEAKKLRIEHKEQFDDWRKSMVEEFIQHYPETYKWQLEFDDWKGMMTELTDIYKEKKV